MRNPTLFKSRGIWQARIWSDSDGKYRAYSLRIQAEGKKERRKEAAAAAVLLAEELKRRTPVPTGSHIEDNLLDFIEWFWSPDSPYVQSKALVSGSPMAKHYIKSNHDAARLYFRGFPGFKSVTVGGLTRAALRDWMLWAATRGISGKVINDALKAMRVAVRWALQRAEIDKDPFMFVERAYHKEKKRGILKPAEIRRLISNPVKDSSIRSRLAIYLPLYCSMRMGEVRGLQWGDIQDGFIHIQHNWQIGEGVKPCKCGSEGYVPVPRLVADLLIRLWDKAKGRVEPTDFVMGFRRGQPVSREYLWESLQRELFVIGICEKRRLERNIVYHSLRHSFVTACRMAGFNAIETMALGRHKDERMHRRYSLDHAQEAIDLADAKRRIDNSFGLIEGPQADG